jgi:hypothetical protein
MHCLTLSAAALVGLAGAAAACPDYTLSYTGDALYTATRFAVTAGGDNSMTSCGFVEEGFVTSSPDFTFDLNGMGPYWLDISVTSACDAMLLVNDAAANWYYDDDSNGNLDPRLSLVAPGDGYLDIWVGTFDGEFCDATLTLETFFH